MRKLVLGQIPDDFNPEIHIPISASCFIGKESIYPDFEKLDFEWSVENNEELVYYDQIASDEALRLVNTIAKANNSNFSKYPFQFWKTIYYPYLGILIPWLLRKQILIEKIIKKHADEIIEVDIVSSDFETEYLNEFQYIIDGIWNPEINEWAFSFILESIIPKTWISHHKFIVKSSDQSTLNRFNKKRRTVKTIILDKIRRVFFRNLGVYGFNILHSIFFHILLSLKPKLDNVVSANKEFSDSRIEWHCDIEQIINQLLPKSLKNIDNTLKEYNEPNSGKIINFSNRLYYNINDKILAALSYNNGGIVMATQHGGHNQGSALTFEYGKNIEYNSNFFISFGPFDAMDKHKGTFIPLPSPMLSGFINKHKSQNDKIILVGTIMNLFSNRFDSVIETYEFKYRMNKVRFLKNLNADNIWYRPYNQRSTSLLDWTFVKSRINNIKKIDGGLHNELKKCKLVVLDHPGTTWNIAMAMNTPTILYWDREHFPFNKKADGFLEKFKEAGLYFDNPQDAARKVNSIICEYKNLTEWWNQKEIQNLRKEWMNIYARADKNWFYIWIKALWKIK